MNNLSIVFQGQAYPLATTLRVAFMVQGQNDHKPYAEIFKDVGTMPVEKQIDIVYAAVVCANKDFAKACTAQSFRDYYLDNYNLKDLLAHLEAVVKGIMGEAPEEADTDNRTSETPGN